MIRRLTVGPAGALRADPASAGRVVRLLAVADERDPALEHEVNRRRLGRIDGVLGCGDLEPDYLSFLADAFLAPLVLVRGNHDRGGAWEAGWKRIPAPLDGRLESVAGIAVLGLSWPGEGRGRAARSEAAAWQQAVRGWLRARLGGSPQVVISHVPPLGSGDALDDPYHTGFAAYSWLLRRLRPRLWLHGHTHPASTPGWRSEMDGTSLANVTGAVLVELATESSAPAAAGATIDGQ